MMQFGMTPRNVEILDEVVAGISEALLEMDERQMSRKELIDLVSSIRSVCIQCVIAIELAHPDLT